MAVRDWHPGQLAIGWAAGLLGLWLIFRVLLGGSSYEEWNGPGWAVAAVGAVIVVALLGATWAWFGSRVPR